MTSSTPSVSPLRQRMLDDMRMCKLSPKTLGVIFSSTPDIGRFPLFAQQAPLFGKFIQAM